MTRAAFLIIVHEDAAQVNTLLRTLDARENLIAVICDARSGVAFAQQVRAMLGTLSKAQSLWLPPRRVTWGGYSLTRAYLDGIRALLQHDAQWQHVINLSGRCLPTQPMPALHAFLAENVGQNFMECRDLITERSMHAGRLDTYFLPLAARSFDTSIPRSMPTWFAPKCGSAWFMLSRAFAEHVHRDAHARRIARYLRWSNITDELCLQSILMNGPFAETAVQNTHRLAEHVDGSPHARVMTQADATTLADGRYFFARKFDARVDASIIDTVIKQTQD